MKNDYQRRKRRFESEQEKGGIIIGLFIFVAIFRFIGWAIPALKELF